MTTATLDAGPTARLRDLVEVEHWRGLAARTPTGDGWICDLTLSRHTRADGGLYPTVDHGAISSYTALAITWTRLTFAGRATRPHQPAPALLKAALPILDEADWLALRLAWERWHCQALSPGCSHQSPPPGEVGEQVAATPDCPRDGYRFGEGWLIRDLPRDIRERSRQIGRALELTR